MRPSTVHPDHTDQAQYVVSQAAKVFTEGGLVVFPTETVYGIGASVANTQGYEALRTFKGRPENQPFSIHLPSAEAADLYVDTSVPMIRRLLRKVFPGPVTVILDVSDDVIDAKLKTLRLANDTRSRLYSNNTIGLRCPDHPIAQKVLGAADAPVVASSANGRREPPPYDGQLAAKNVAGAAQLIIDDGRTRYAKPSTIIRICNGALGLSDVSVVRNGVYDERFIRKLLRWTMLVVCSGNTCRSPMAEVLAKQVLAEQRGVSLDAVESMGIRVWSAGVSTASGAPASTDSAQTMRKLGLDLSKHRSRPLTIELIHEADVIYCMTSQHVEAVLAMAPSAGDLVYRLDPNGDVEDPIGSGPNGYHRCAELIRRRLEQRLKEQQP